MVQRNFILTDLMKTGNTPLLEGYVRFNSLKDQEFTMTGEYYTIFGPDHRDVSTYDRKIALIDIRTENQRVKSKVFDSGIQLRIKKLKEMGFVFIFATPYESQENVESMKQLYYPTLDMKAHKWYGGVSWFWYYMILKHVRSKFNVNHYKKKYTFLYLNKNPRGHRIKLYDKLIQHRLIENSLVSFVDHPTKPFDLPKEYELPWLDAKQPYPKTGMDQELFDKPYQDTVASIVSETNDNNTDVFMTEKVWKPILMEQIFVVHGNYQYLKKLKELGFKTFENIIDESYDNEKDRNLRIEKLVGAIRSITDRSHVDLYSETIEIRKHNKKHFFNRSAFSEVVNKEILSWLKFFDSSQVSSTKS